jgi:hypothetical protein
MTPLPYEPPEPPARRTIPRIPSIAYKIAGLIILALLLYWTWRRFTRLPPAQPVRYPAEYIPTSFDRFHV